MLIKDLQKAETNQYCNEVLTFINCLLACCDNVEERSSIRDELAGIVAIIISCLRHISTYVFLALNLMDILVKWR